MLRDFREEGEASAIEGEVSRFLAAGRQPVAIEVERGRLQIVGVADDAQDCAASAGDRTGLDLLAVCLDCPISADTQV